MDAFLAHHADIRDRAQQSHIAAQLRDQGLVTFSGTTDPAVLVTVAQRLMAIRPHRDAGPDGVTVITGTGTKTSGYAAFTDAELVPHTDGSSVPDPPGLLGARLPVARRSGRGDAGRRRRRHHRRPLARHRRHARISLAFASAGYTGTTSSVMTSIAPPAESSATTSGQAGHMRVGKIKEPPEHPHC